MSRNDFLGIFVKYKGKLTDIDKEAFKLEIQAIDRELVEVFWDGSGEFQYRTIKDMS